MELKWGKTVIYSGAVLLAGGIVFFCGYSFAAMLFLCAAIHETGHAVAIKIAGGNIKAIHISASGVRMEYLGNMNYGADLAIALAGPLMSLIAAVLCVAAARKTGVEMWYLAAGINTAFFAFNIMPVSALDGGCAIRAALCGLGKFTAAERIGDTFDTAVCAILACFALFSAAAGNITGIICTVSVLSVCCKKRENGVNF